MDHLTILNRNAGNFNWQDLINISHQLKNLNGQIFATKSLSQLEEILKLSEENQPKIIGLGGGDGTASQTLTLIDKIWGEIPEFIALYSMGTMNNISIASGWYSSFDKFKRVFGAKTKPVELAKYLSRNLRSREGISTQNIALLDANGRKGFNIGFGVIPKLVWLYYGNSIEHYQKFDQNLQENKIIDYSTDKGGAYQALSTMAKSITGVMKKNSLENRFFTERVEADIYVDGHKINLPQQPTGIYLASYENISMGLPLFSAKITPEARSIPGKMQIVISWANPKDYVKSVPSIFIGKHMQNAIYVHAEELEIRSEKVIPCQVDADYVFNNNFKISYDQNLKIVSPRST